MDLQMKRQISSISFSHADVVEKDGEQGGELEHDPKNLEFWQDALVDSGGAMNAQLEAELLQEYANLTAASTGRKLSKKFSLMKSEEVEMKYEYWLDVHNPAYGSGQQLPVVHITGQFNDWSLDELKMDVASSPEASNEGAVIDSGANIDNQGKLKFTYSKWVKGGQIYNFHLLVDGERTVDEDQKKTPNGKSNWIFVPLSEKNQQKVNEIFSKPLSLRMLKLKKLSQSI